ncbi:hypothetical protein CNMCM5793_005508 [Aspergillus hiratsukae]|uniref:Uncharacterized protein n=1 Tax=Aspergillus hiratsukae TaxID=1194566 RepID=A0A8H6QD98_9EURO|nr:hypothetical protein CNMCM5793_005508 [Aspergillus hiratsukae]KAF7171646.1 hypothetical protein CNMCM6106_006046 [Aspergillus hiratsukae]
MGEKSDAEHVETIEFFPNIQDGRNLGLESTKKSAHLALTPELLETLYLATKAVQRPQQSFANAGALGFMGFTIADCTFAMVLMGWGGATSVESVIGIFFFTGPLLLILATILEWVRGQFLSMMICGFFSVFWFSFGMLNLPSVGIAATYSPTGNAIEGAASVGYNAGIALYLVALGFTLLTFFIFTLRLNLVMVFIFGMATVAVYILSAAYWMVSTGNYAMAGHLQKAGGAILFAVGLAGWYMTVVIMCVETGWPIPPVGDLSKYWAKGNASQANGADSA